jgi:GDP-L-fucose synthase
MNLDKATYDRHTSPMRSHLNVGCGHDVTIKELAESIGRTVGFEGRILFDPDKPDGAPRKLMDSTVLNQLGWQARTTLETGLQRAYADFVNRLAQHD